MVRYLEIFLFIFVFGLSTFAQQNDNIPNGEDSIRQTVSQNRRLLLNRFYATRLDSVSLLLDSIDRHHPEQTLLWTAERLLLYYWIERYDAIDSIVRNFDKFDEKNTVHPPQEQMVWNVLSYYSQENYDTLVAWIDDTKCSDKVFDFRIHLLTILLHNDLDDSSSIVREIRLLREQYFLQEEPATPEAPPVTSKQVEPQQTNDDTWRAGLVVGMGTVSTSGKIAKYLSVKSSLSFDWNVNHERLYFSLLMQVSFARLKRDLGVWEAGKLAFVSNIGLSTGYSVIDSRFFRMSPFIGMVVSDCSPSEQQIENDNALRDAGIRWGITSMYGLDTDIKLYNMFHFLESKDFLASLNIRLNYIPSMFDNVNNRYSGNMFFVSFGIRIDISTR